MIDFVQVLYNRHISQSRDPIDEIFRPMDHELIISQYYKSKVGLVHAFKWSKMGFNRTKNAAAAQPDMPPYLDRISQNTNLNTVNEDVLEN